VKKIGKHRKCPFPEVTAIKNAVKVRNRELNP
jgi:hypothetical protein